MPDDASAEPAAELTAEHGRLRDARERTRHWKRWGPYLSDRAWGTVREDYSGDGDAWESFPHDHARSRAYRWNEDGLLGFSDRHGRICLSIALWNGQDPILKERLFGLTPKEGNHGEDVKEVYFHLDALPSHAYNKSLYRYPQAEFPYARLVEESRRRTREDPEFELPDTGVLERSRFFDVVAEWAKGDDQEDLLLRITVTNHGSEAAELHLLPQVWFRNVWSWRPNPQRPSLSEVAPGVLQTQDRQYGRRHVVFEGAPKLLFTENETNAERLFGAPNPTPFVKDAFHEAIVHRRSDATNPAQTGTKAAAHYHRVLQPGETWIVRVRFAPMEKPIDADFDAIVEKRIAETDEFYDHVLAPIEEPEKRRVARQAFAGLFLSKSYYHYVVQRWREGDSTQPAPPPGHAQSRNKEWEHLYASDVLSMPDAWEYPWFAAWDLAFHTLPIALADPDLAKDQLTLLTREWYMHPNGQLPAYEWSFGDVNPPVHAWAARRVYEIEGGGDRSFLERAFHKMLLNFTWWVNRKDVEGNNVFEGGFLGMDNVGVFDRSAPLPTGGHIEQSDGTSWMAFFSLQMLAIATELSKEDSAYEDTASKFWEHFLYIAQAMVRPGSSLWDDEDGFFYDVLRLPSGERRPLKVRSMVGLVPLLAVATLGPDDLERMPGFTRRMEWFLEHRPDLVANVAAMEARGAGERRLMAVVGEEKLRRILAVMLDESEFLSPYGVRSLSRRHLEEPYVYEFEGHRYEVAYDPGEGRSDLFGGNSNWRGPVWMPMNYLLIGALRQYDEFFGSGLKIECPTGSGIEMTLGEVADEIGRRVTSLFLPDAGGKRPAWGASPLIANDPLWRDHVPFFEFFHGDTGAGLGAGHQTGWTALVAELLLNR